MKKRVSKTRQVEIREKGLKSTLRFGMKLVLILAVVIGCAQLLFYGKDMMADRSNDPTIRIATKNNEARNNQSDSIKTGEQGNVLRSFPSGSEKGRQQIPETIASFVKSSDGSRNAMQAVPPSGDASLDPASGKNELLSVFGPTDASKPMITFISDDGPCYSVDIRILDTLQVYGDRAAFFIIGNRVSGYRDTLKRIRDSGSETGDHAFNHRDLEKISPGGMASRVGVTNDAVEVVTGLWLKLMRVPYGAFKSQMPNLISYPIIQWNIDTQGWFSKDKDAIVVSVLSQARDGSIVLMHDLYPVTAEALETVIPLLAAQRYQFVTVNEMYAVRGVSLEVRQIYSGILNQQGRQIYFGYLAICFIQIR